MNTVNKKTFKLTSLALGTVMGVGIVQSASAMLCPPYTGPAIMAMQGQVDQSQYTILSITNKSTKNNGIGYTVSKWDIGAAPQVVLDGSLVNGYPPIGPGQTLQFVLIDPGLAQSNLDFQFFLYGGNSSYGSLWFETANAWNGNAGDVSFVAGPDAEAPNGGAVPPAWIGATQTLQCDGYYTFGGSAPAMVSYDIVPAGG